MMLLAFDDISMIFECVLTRQMHYIHINMYGTKVEKISIVREKGKKPPTTHHTQEKVKVLCEDMMALSSGYCGLLVGLTLQKSASFP